MNLCSRRLFISSFCFYLRMAIFSYHINVSDVFLNKSVLPRDSILNTYIFDLPYNQNIFICIPLSLCKEPFDEMYKLVYTFNTLIKLLFKNIHSFLLIIAYYINGV
ncbi:hypothetical protein KUTeg_000464 [Tegillarca granosa]|uniref:Secreted protein n=1 Tax=Tegillarca granosa TaxID=220873 RepID=A0ABQ9FXM8_TEGGR|nr:hypothetical protein KUTeg_000464 [Tegillarca granosa]